MNLHRTSPIDKKIYPFKGTLLKDFKCNVTRNGPCKCKKMGFILLACMQLYNYSSNNSVKTGKTYLCSVMIHDKILMSNTGI